MKYPTNWTTEAAGIFWKQVHIINNISLLQPPPPVTSSKTQRNPSLHPPPPFNDSFTSSSLLLAGWTSVSFHRPWQNGISDSWSCRRPTANQTTLCPGQLNVYTLCDPNDQSSSPKKQASSIRTLTIFYHKYKTIILKHCRKLQNISILD